MAIRLPELWCLQMPQVPPALRGCQGQEVALSQHRAWGSSATAQVSHPSYLSKLIFRTYFLELSCIYLSNISCSCLKLYWEWVICSFALIKTQWLSLSFWYNWVSARKSLQEAAGHNSVPSNKLHYSVSGLLMDYPLEKLFGWCFLIGF